MEENKKWYWYSAEGSAECNIDIESLWSIMTDFSLIKKFDPKGQIQYVESDGPFSELMTGSIIKIKHKYWFPMHCYITKVEKQSELSYKLKIPFYYRLYISFRVKKLEEEKSLMTFQFRMRTIGAPLSRLLFSKMQEKQISNLLKKYLAIADEVMCERALTQVQPVI